MVTLNCLMALITPFLTDAATIPEEGTRLPAVSWLIGADIAVGVLSGLADLFGGAVADAACLLLDVGLALVILRTCG